MFTPAESLAFYIEAFAVLLTTFWPVIVVCLMPLLAQFIVKKQRLLFLFIMPLVGFLLIPFGFVGDGNMPLAAIYLLFILFLVAYYPILIIYTTVAYIKSKQQKNEKVESLPQDPTSAS